MPRALHVLPDPEVASSHAGEDAERLLFQIGRQDRFAFETLYALWAPPLLGVAMRILNDREEAEEAMQDTFVRLWHRAADYDGNKSKPFVWCYAILRSVCIDRIRHQRRQKRDHTKSVSWDDRDAAEPQHGPGILGSDTVNAVRLALKQLPHEERRCLELAVFLEYTHTEISDELQTPLGTVKNRLRRALAKLQTTLSRHELA